jgi:hypothetical protein
VAKRRDLESPIQRAILEAIWAGYPQVTVFAVPNGGYIMEPRIVAKLKWLGLLPGVPDLCLVWPGDWGMIEVKSEDGTLSDAQRDLHPILRSLGVRLAICRSVADLIQTLTEWAVPTRIQQGRAA